MNDDVVRATRFELTDRHGTPRAILACDPDSGAPTCSFLDGSGTTRVVVGIAWNDMPSIQLNAEDGTARIAMIVRPEDAGLMLVADAGGHKQVLTAEGLSAE